MRKLLFKTFSIFMVTAFVASNSFLVPALAQEDITTEATINPNTVQSEEIIDLLTGEVVTIDAKNLSRVAVANPDIVDISDAKADKVFVSGKKAGQSEVFVWDDSGKRSIVVRVASENLKTLRMRVQEILDRAQIKGVSLEENLAEGKVILYGSIPKADKDILDKVMDPYVDRIINLVKTEVIEDLVQIDIQVTELSTTLTKQIGLDWNSSSASGASSGVSANGNATSTAASAGSGGLNLSYNEVGLRQKSGGKLFNVASFNRTTPITVAVNALIQEGKARILSKPRLVVMSGKEASFLVGGEVPIRTSTVNATGGQSQDNVTFKQYGVNMTITPTIRLGKIETLLNVKISDIDKSTVNDKGDVGYISRQAQTQLFLDDKQTVVLAGLIKHSEGETVKGIPYLSKIPIAGALFRTRQSANPNSDTELVISLTATILKSKKFTTEQDVLPSKRSEGYVKYVDSNFDKEPIGGKMPEPPKVPAPAAIPAPVMPVKRELRPIVLASSQVPDMIAFSYVRSIQLKISQGISYPYEALQKNWEGTVKLRLRILKDGTLADCDLLESSGHDIFDSNAISTTRSQSPFLAFPQEMTEKEDLVVIVPIVYNHSTAPKKDTQTVVASY